MENAPVPRDRRVWQEALSLSHAGWDVTVLGPRLTGWPQPSQERCEGISVHRFELSSASGGLAAWLREYAWALWRIWAAVRRLSKDGRFDVIHLANPPDVLVLAVAGQRLRGTALIFDQHDLMPEMAIERFAGAGRPLARVLSVAERLAHKLTHVSVVANESFRALALARGGRAPEDVMVVRNGPRLERFVPVEPDPSLARGRPHLLVYEGMMGPLDGVDAAIRALAILRLQRHDWHALFLGAGEELPALKRLVAELNLEEHVEFGGFVSDPELRRAICSADVCLAPDRRNALTDVSTLIKIAEYMAMAKPTVSFALAESRVTAGDSAVYARDDDHADFARLVGELLDDPERRKGMGREGRARVEERFSWAHSERALLGAYDRALEKAGSTP